MNGIVSSDYLNEWFRIAYKPFIVAFILIIATSFILQYFFADGFKLVNVFTHVSFIIGVIFLLINSLFDFFRLKRAINKKNDDEVYHISFLNKSFSANIFMSIKYIGFVVLFFFL